MSTAPTLQYVGSVDISSSTDGTASYNCLIPADFLALGNLLMFEYKLQLLADTTPTPAEIVLGYINVDNAIQIGISNQYQLAVPALDALYNPEASLTVQIRAYVGVTGTPDVDASEWSNALTVHNPPSPSDIHFAVFNTDLSGNNDLFVVLNLNTALNYSEIDFVICYYYSNSLGETQWRVSNPISSTELTIGTTGYRLLTISDFGVVDPTNLHVYTSVYGIFTFTDASNNYYSVSQISDTFDAIPADPYAAPTLSTLFYEVYSLGSQNMVLTWAPPVSSFIEPYVVDYYVVQMKVDTGAWADLSGHIASPTVTYTADVSAYADAHHTLSFRVYAVSVSNVQSDNSNVLFNDIFVFSTAPTALSVPWCATDASAVTMDITVVFSNPSDVGIYDLIETPYFLVNIFDSVGDVILPANRQVAYTVSPGSYVVTYTDLPHSPSGQVTVALSTGDTNSTDQEVGVEANTTYTTSSLPIIRDVELTSLTLSFEVVSQTLLDLYCAVQMFVPGPGLFLFVNWSSLPGSYTNYTVERSQIADGPYVYTVTMVPGIFGEIGEFTNVSMLAANDVGIGHAEAVLP